ncbi:glycoside hydrolase [Erythrobacter rubeus]|uniref:Glycoside hydrolase n=1 Tax=Erythrobacter rubeus TaxID=2760803 RepID=A0ABR8KL29_9SPHN|nr:glycoside hydrolase [Erythrobacter rubeus]MBD2841015.1 glycoside hydrolase [Erythrobacter rubeus]
MELTYIGVVQAIIGLYIVLLGSVRSAIFFLILSAILMGSAAVVLPALGGSSIPPVQFALLFTTLRILAPKGGYLGFLPDAVGDNKWLIFFAMYGMASAYLAPRLFAGSFDVFPMQPIEYLGPFGTVPLAPTPQNITATFYMFGAVMLALSCNVMSRMPGAAAAMISAIITASWIHITSGILDLTMRGTPFEDFLAIFRNASYAQLDATASGFVRIRGLLAEASIYAGLGFALFVATAEMWYRSIRSSVTGWTAIGLAMMLVLSTASTAYVALAVYAALFMLRAILFPSAAPAGKLMRAAIAAFGAVFFLCALFIFVPQLPIAIWELIAEMTFGKSESLSGQQRLFWAMQGWHALIASYGLGIGPGSFRSSSQIMAVLGSVGIFGFVAFVLYLVRTFEATRRSSWGLGATPRKTLGGALGSAAILCLIPASISGPSPVPMAFFSIMAGAAIALRRPVQEAVETSPDAALERGGLRSFPAKGARGPRKTVLRPSNRVCAR